MTGNYPSPAFPKPLLTALGRKFVVLVDTLSSDLTSKADVLLPGATWAEKAGTFENIHNRLQTFDSAIVVIEMAKGEGQIALDLAAVCGLAEKQIYDPASVRPELGGIFLTDVHHPPGPRARQADMQYVEL